MIGDIHLTRHSKFVIFLTRQLFGIKYPFSHCTMAIGGDWCISAEWPKVKLVRIKESEVNSKRTVIIRPPEIYQQRRLIQAIYTEYLGKRYDWAKYVLWTMQISVVLAPLVYLAFLPLRRWLRKKERKYYDCVELVATILEGVGCPIGVDDLTYTWPDMFMMLAKAAPMEWKIVFDSEKK